MEEEKKDADSSIKVEDDKDKNIKSSENDKVQKLKEIASRSKLDLLKSRVLKRGTDSHGRDKINSILKR